MKMDVYKKLVSHLDNLPGGFAPSDSGAELRLLKRLFTPEEAELAVYLTLEREEAHTIANRAGISIAEVEQRLKTMAGKGLIFSIEAKDSPALYQAVPWIVGIYEFQVNKLDKEFAEDLTEYGSTIRKNPRPQPLPQMRTIPVGISIEAASEALPYERAEELVNAHEKYAVAPCICRRKAKLMGSGCDAPEESCLVFGEWADYYARNGQGRYIDRGDVLDILAKADKANLVLQPSNSKEISFLCTCCGCCCGVLLRLKRHPKPSEVVASPFIAGATPETCDGCGICLDRCQMGALALEDERVVLDSDRCIGCGLCVSTCPTGSLILERKSTSKHLQVPLNLETAWKEISLARAEKQTG
jgi:Na+-translocating ferredoxin:NAD+ oxidoreductase subunit B